MIKKLLSVFLVLCMLITLVPATTFAALSDGRDAVPSSNTTPFTDIMETDWFYDAVLYANDNGFFSGTSATTFDPNGTMTRGMFVTVLGRMAGVDTANYIGESTFSDVPADAYYAPYVEWAAKYGITSGMGDGKFSPDTYIDRQQMAVFFVRYFEAFNVSYDTGANITTTPEDIDTVAPWARDAVLKLWRTGLLNGDGKGFNPSGNATRAQVAMFCYAQIRRLRLGTRSPEPKAGALAWTLILRIRLLRIPTPLLKVPQLPVVPQPLITRWNLCWAAGATLMSPCRRPGPTLLVQELPPFQLPISKTECSWAGTMMKR